MNTMQHADWSKPIDAEPEIYFSGSPSQWSNAPYFASCLLAAGASMSVRLFVPSIAWVAFLIVPLACLAMIGVRYLATACTHFTVDSSRVTIDLGILNKTQVSLELFRVQDVQSRRDWWMRLVGIGDIVFSTSDTSYPHVTLFGMPNVDALRTKLNRRAIDLRNLYGYREINMGRV